MSEKITHSDTVNVEGARLQYVVEGSGIPVMVIGSAIYYPRAFSCRLSESCRMAFVDVRHFAENDTSFDVNKISLNTYIEDLERVRARLGIDRAVVCGHSHHGNLAIEYAKRYPERVSHVVLIGSPPCDVASTVRAAEDYWEQHADERRKAVLQSNLTALQSKAPERMAPQDAYVARYVAEAPRYWYDPLYDASHLWREVPINMEVVNVFRDMFANGYELHWDPEQMQSPVLAIMGRYDYAVPHTLWEHVRPTLRNFTCHLLERSGHTPQLEQPEDFDRLFLDWLRANSG